MPMTEIAPAVARAYKSPENLTLDALLFIANPYENWFEMWGVCI
jgi:hypothetical protein